ncbi:hypothetical protein AB0I49_16935 [Streptomyces sp. NPDC050617]|uniref:hypothetical protein n=1 Tax=Streptomyces sp. NPDC050617 TaxID=3154628 RepID=UPI0034149358
MTRYITMTRSITLLDWNVEGGIHWEEAASWMAAQRPDVVFRQELRIRYAQAEARRLGMMCHLGISRANMDRDNPKENAVFLRGDGPLDFFAEHPQSWAPWYAPAHVTVKTRDRDGTLSPRKMALVSGHACHWSPLHRLVEAQWCSTLAQYGQLAIQWWDWNSYREGERDSASWEGYEDHAYVANRTYLQGGQRITDDRPDRELRAAGYVEIARFAAEHRGQPEALRPASGYRERPGRPAGRRYCVDRGYLTAELAPAIVSAEVCDTPRLRQISDHLPHLARLDYDTVRDILHRSSPAYQPPTEEAPLTPVLDQPPASA